MISDLLAARSQMAMSFGFHIVFAALGIAMPALMAVAEWRWLKTQNKEYLELAKRWSKGTAILFAVGAVSWTVLSFVLGLLWPSFMERAGPVIGPLFGLEGFAFFTEAIFLGIYLYGWSRIPPRAHFFAGLIVAASGTASTIFVVTVNAWLNAPSGFEIINGRVANVRPFIPFLHPFAFHETLHMLLAAFAATGLLVAGIHAFLLLRSPSNRFHKNALVIALVVGGIPAIFQPVSGDLIARAAADHQPAKLAAMEALFVTEAGADFVLFGLPDVVTQTIDYAVVIPHGLSLLLHGHPHAVVLGLDRIPRLDWPPVAVTHIAFQVDGFTGAPPIRHRIFAWSSLITPTMLGIVLGAIASGRASGPTDTIRETFVDPWLGRFPLAVGVLATALVAYLAAVYLIMESSDPELRRLFRGRAVISGILVMILAATALFLSHDGAPEIYRGLVDTALGRATIVATALVHVAALWALMTARNLLARFLAGGGAIAILWGWALSQYPYLVEPSVTIYDAAPHSTLDILLASVLLGSILLLPFLYYLYNLFKGDVLSHPHG